MTALATASAMLLSVVVISGCNEEPSTPSTPPAGGAGAGKAPEKAPGPPPAPTKEEKK